MANPSRRRTHVRSVALAILAITATTAFPAASPPDAATNASRFYFPPATGAWERVPCATVGWDEAKLNAALAMAGATRASGVVVLHRGRILAEQYWDIEPDARAGKNAREYGGLVRGRDAEGHVIEDVASVQKSVAAILVGVAQHQGLLRLDDPVSRHVGAGWTKAAWPTWRTPSGEALRCRPGGSAQTMPR